MSPTQAKRGLEWATRREIRLFGMDGRMVGMGDWKTELTGRVLVLVSHADDESVGYGALLQRMREAVVVIATDGAPRDEYFWRQYGSREAYAAVRRDEVRRATQLAGVRELVLLAEEDSRLEDQRLFLNLAAAYERLEKLVERVRPEAIATLAYEGGHPDHDSCSFLGARLGERFALPVWEAPLYNWADAGAVGKVCKIARSGRKWWRSRRESARTAGAGPAKDAAAAGSGQVQHFICETGDEVVVEISDGELERKRMMCAQYTSQDDFLQTFDVGREVVRRQVRYNYRRAPHLGKTKYERWQWWMSARDVCAKFQEFLETVR
jgi:LmbE family N-acetylglucosaminyl deacetylase